MIRRAMILVASMAVLAIPAAQAQYDPASITLCSTTPEPGQVCTVSGTGCFETFNFDQDPQPAQVTIELDGEPVAATKSGGPNGQFSADITIPEDISPGIHTVSVVCGSRVLAAEFEIGGEGDLADTGSNSSLPLAQVGAGLVALGGLLTLAVRRRNRSALPVEIDA